LGAYLADDIRTGRIPTDGPEFAAAEQGVRERIEHFLSNPGDTPVDEFHRRLGRIMWDECGMARNAEGLKKAMADIAALREEFWKKVRVPGRADQYNPELDKAGRVADALERNESCGGHFREEFQTPEGEALRDDEQYTYVAAWECNGSPSEARLVKEPLVYENIELKQRSYK
jgi:succinate dehydrogenase / fumarate reductase flavoprotein subunit